MRIRPLWFVLLTISPSAQVAGQEDVWTTVRSGGSVIEIPEFLTSGPMRALFENGVDHGTSYEPDDHSIWLRQYHTESIDRPYVYLTKNIARDVNSIEYSVDKELLGVVSGYAGDGDKTIIYAMCRKEKREIRCIDLEYPTAQRAYYDPIVERIAASFTD